MDLEKTKREIVDNQMTRLRQFLDAEREFEDAIAVDEYVEPVTVLPDGRIVDAAGRGFGPEFGRGQDEQDSQD